MKIPATLKLNKRSVEETWVEETKGFIVEFGSKHEEAVFVDEKGEIGFYPVKSLTVDMGEF